jgi:glycerol-3-phosphate O-acyltransferase
VDDALAKDPARLVTPTVEHEFGPIGRVLGHRYFEDVRFPKEAEARLRELHAQGFVVHVMRSTSWVNYLYLTWALIRRGLPPVRAVVNLRRWLTKPWRRTAQRGAFDVRFTYARRQGGSGLIFLRQTVLGTASGRKHREDPFPALVAMARRSDTPVFLVPELFVWEKWNKRLRPSLIDRVFGSPETPGFLHSVLAFFRNYQRAQFRVGDPIDLRAFVAQNAGASDALLARKIRSALHHHLARETRAVFGPPYKRPARVIEETLRDRVLRRSLEEHAAATGRPLLALQREAKKCLEAIAARQHPTVVALTAPVLSVVFNRIYDGIEVDEAGLERALRAASRAPIVLCPSHKSHVDYLVLSWVLWTRGYSVPLVAAGANLSFFPLGPFLRRGGAFFLRRSFKGDKVYTATFKAYVKKLVHDGVHQEFFPEGGRSRSGKLLRAKLGMFTWQVEAVLEGARPDLYFVPVSIDYEKVVESGSYSRELAGGEKRPEDLKALLSAPKVLASRYGRIHLGFDEPISLAELAHSRGAPLAEGMDENAKRGLVRALGNRVMYGISRASTVTPQALASAALLSHRGRGIGARELAERITSLRRIAAEERVNLSRVLHEAPSDPTVMGPIQEALRALCRDEMVRVQEARGETIYLPVDERRAELSFYKNTLMNLVAPRAVVANAVIADGETSVEATRERALFLSRVFKLEFIFQVGVSFEALFDGTAGALERMGLIDRSAQGIGVAPEAHAAPELAFVADLARDFIEGYFIAAVALKDALATGCDRKGFGKLALEVGRAEYLAGRISAPESLSRTTMENALAYFLDVGLVVEADRKLQLGPNAGGAASVEALAAQLRRFVRR